MKFEFFNAGDLVEDVASLYDSGPAVIDGHELDED